MFPPRIDLWPPAVRSAERLHGTLVPCGPGLRPVGWPDTPSVRRIAIGDLMPSQLIASHQTAAWIWQSTRRAGKPLRAIQKPTTRNTFLAGVNTKDLIRIRQQRITREDIAVFDDLCVTTPFRTVLDLLYDPHDFDVVSQVACRLIMLKFPGVKVRVCRSVHESRHPQRPLARARLARVLSLPGKVSD